jgi:hypothetical protein
MLKSFLFVALFFIAIISGCNDNSTNPADCVRTGAICNDGTTSTATGSGACSGHGGVKEWICK